MHPVRYLGIVAIMTATAFAGPQPIGDATITVSYQTKDGGTYTATETRNFHGTNPSDATTFGDAPTNMSMFSSVNVFGRRAHVAQFFPEVIAPTESLLTFSWYKLNTAGDYFPDITENGVVRVTVEGIHFNEPVQFQRDTFLFYNEWDTQQVDTAILHGLFESDVRPQFFHTLTDPFRDADKFRQIPGEFSPKGQTPLEALGDLVPYICFTGDGTDTIGFVAQIPYQLFRNPHETKIHHSDPYDGLPSPHDFLEPYHFHFEYAVSAVPGSSSFSYPLETWSRCGGYEFGVDSKVFPQTKPPCDPLGPRWRVHTGFDACAKKDTKVMAAADGTIVHWTTDIGGGWGGAVVIEHDLDGDPVTARDRVTTLYLHVVPELWLQVNPDPRDSRQGFPNLPVGRGFVIAKVQGIASGAHLHFGYRKKPFNRSRYGESRYGALPATGAHCPVSSGKGNPIPDFPDGWTCPAELFSVPQTNRDVTVSFSKLNQPDR